ncbi:MAG: YgjP-like metallopeptidase domain-containing protein [Coriobacteriia bacterium]
MTLPEHTVRVSLRARRVRLKVTSREGLVVVVPPRFPLSRVPAVLAEQGPWIERALARVAERRTVFTAQVADVLPVEVEFAATGERWEVAYAPSAARDVRVRERDGRIVVSGAVDDAQACLDALARWLQRAAGPRLRDAVGTASADSGMSCAAVRVRGQRGRWGSCSAAGTVTLNRALLFLPAPLVRHVVLHELAHTARLDHSPAFHALLCAHDLHARRHARELRRGWEHVPAWAQRGRAG